MRYYIITFCYTDMYYYYTNIFYYTNMYYCTMHNLTNICYSTIWFCDASVIISNSKPFPKAHIWHNTNLHVTNMVPLQNVLL